MIKWKATDQAEHPTGPYVARNKLLLVKPLQGIYWSTGFYLLGQLTLLPLTNKGCVWSTVSFWLHCPAILLLLLGDWLEHGASLKSTPALTVHDLLVQVPIIIELTQLSLSQVQLLKSQILIDLSRIGNPQLVLWAVLGAGGPQWYVPGAMGITLTPIKAPWIRK